MRDTIALLRVIITALAVMTMGMVVSAGPASAEGDLPAGYYICHATGNESTPEAVRNWVTNYPADSGQAKGHAGVEHQNGLDIIPPIPGVLPQGQNWTEYGQQVHALGCRVPVDPDVSFTDNSCVNGSYVAPTMVAPEYAGLTKKVAGTVGPGSTVTVTYTAKQGFGIVGDSTFTHTFPASPASQLDCDQVIPVAPEVDMVDECATANDSGPTFVRENEHWTAVVDGNSVVFTAKSGWKFADGSRTKTVPFTPNTNELCSIPVPPQVTTHDECGTANDSGPTFVADNQYWTAAVSGNTVVFTAKTGWKFDNGGTTKTVPFEPNTNEPCPIPIQTVPAVTVHDECGTANDTGPSWLVDDAKYLGVDEGAGTVTFTAVAPYHFVGKDGERLNQVEVGYTPNADEPCTEPLPMTPGVLDGCGVGNAMWVVPADVSGLLDWTLGQDGHLRVTVLTPETVFEDTDSATYDFGLPKEAITEPCPIPIQTVPAVTVHDECGTANDTGPSWVVDDAKYLGVDEEAGTVIFTAVAPYHFVGKDGERLNQVEVGYTPNRAKPCIDVEGEEKTSPQDNPPKNNPPQGNPPQGNPPEDTVEVRGVQQSVAVPTVVNAGLGSTETPAGRSANGLWLVAMGGGLLMIGFAGSRRRATSRR